ncbi:hypothetical protein NicSoilB4_05130 [Arthrobacter sp. NicSoilB4]|nr:hypothetical protein NicSoilB4_05130 [Arthrobacter sp. NicSoilB4]
MCADPSIAQAPARNPRRRRCPSTPQTKGSSRHYGSPSGATLDEISDLGPGVRGVFVSKCPRAQPPGETAYDPSRAPPSQGGPAPSPPEAVTAVGR